MTGTFEKRWKKDFSEMNVIKAEWMVTRRCNLMCGYCKIRDESTLRGPEMPTETLVKTVEMFGKLWPGAPMIVYGGEPTMRDDLPELLAAGKRYGVKLPVISNSIRVMRDHQYAESLVRAGLENWSVSFDGFEYDEFPDKASHQKSGLGFQALRMFRDNYGIRDLVACVTVTKYNIAKLPAILRKLTEEGFHAIFTPLHVGDERYEYGRGDADMLPTQTEIEDASHYLYVMVSSGQFLCSNDAGWFKVWPEHFLKQNWMCNDKSCITIDADGSLKYCVDIPFRPEDQMHVLDLATEDGRQKWLRIIQKGPNCKGCLWNPAYESIKRARDPEIGVVDGRSRARHYVGPTRSLYAGAQRWFAGNPHLKRIQ